MTEQERRKIAPNKPKNLMNRRQIWTFAAAATTATVILSGGDALAAAQFDGRWTLTLRCSKAPDGSRGYTVIFGVNINDGTLVGDYVVAGQNNGHFHLDGPIRPDGSAYLHMTGETGKSGFSYLNPKPGTPFDFDLDVKFTASQGKGRRVQIRPCDATFSRRKAGDVDKMIASPP